MDEESKKSIIDCANECKGKASMFIFGTNDFGNDRCSEQGCSCSCEISATRGGTCNMVSHTGYRLYKFLDNGKYFLYDTNTNESLNEGEFSYHTLSYLAGCSYRNFLTNAVVIDEGNEVGHHQHVDVDQCKKHCDQTSGCNSFAIAMHGNRDCHLKDKVLHGNEATRQAPGWNFYYLICG